MKYNQNRSEDIKKAVSIVIPVINEQRTIKQLITDIFDSFSGTNIIFEVIIIDDHSTDRTPKIIAQLKKKYQIRYFLKNGLKGKAYSLLEGFSYARYNLLAMIDGDLQYPASAIPEMVKKINHDVGVVVAKRNFVNVKTIRKFLSLGFSHLFAGILHGLPHDVQSGLKVFKTEIVERISVNPGPWSFDLEFLIKAKNAGYKIVDHQIDFLKRPSGVAKIALIPAIIEIGMSALKLKFAESHPIDFHKHLEKKKGEGFHSKGTSFMHHSNLPHVESAFKTLYRNQKIFLLSILCVFILGLIINWKTTLIVFIAVITCIYFIDLFFNLFLIIRGFTKSPEIQIHKSETNKLTAKNLPKYTILCPLYHEWGVLPQFVTAMSRLDYPKDKLQVILLLEEDDTETIKHAESYDLPDYFQIAIVPDSLPKTKPKALNYGLKKTDGEYVVIYDAEDIPDPLQLKKVVAAFNKSDKKTVCIQAKLNFYNPHQNILTRIFTAEYSLWFDLVLTGLQSLFAPIPLGGTSNHFRTSDLKLLKGWDSFNVTEDCDLGMRLVRKGYQTALINSVTLEEANSDVMNWFEQRSRWIKGYIQTYLVHMRSPGEILKNTSAPHFFIFQIFVGGKVLFMFLNPLLWLTTFLYFAFRPYLGVFIQQFFPGPVLYMGVFSLVFGNFLYMYYYMIACVKRNHHDLVKYVYLIPLYWIAMSIASWKAVIQLIHRPHFWPKTIHGFHLGSEKIIDRAVETVGRNLVDTRYAAYPSGFAPVFAQTKKSSFFDKLSKKTISSGGFLLASMMGANFLNLLFNVYLGRTISFADFGLITFINTIWYLLGIFATPLGTSMNHRTAFISAKYGKGAAANFLKITLKKVAKISLLLTVVWLLLTPLLAVFFKLDGVMPLLLFTPAIFFASMSSVGEGYLGGSFYFVILGLITLFTALIKIISTVVLVKLKLPSLTYLSIPLAVVAASFISFAFLYSKVRKIKIDNQHNFRFPKRFFVAAIISGFSANAFLTFDVMLTKHYLSPQLAGEYAFLSLIGKMIFFFGSMLSTFIIPYVSHDMGANRNPNKNFYRILTATTVLTVLMYVGLGWFGGYFIPLVFGAKAYPILPYINLYSLAISMYVITSAVVRYHLARHHYLFPATALFFSLVMCAGIALFHRTVADVVMVILFVSMISLNIILALHLLMRDGSFLIKNLIDFGGLFVPLPKANVAAVRGKRVLIFNWRDTKHKFAGGAEVYLHELAKRWVKSGNQVTLFCGNDGNNPRNEVIDGVQIYRRGGFYFVYVWAFFYYIFKFRNKFDVIIDSENGIPFFTPLYSREKKFLLIHHVHQEVFRKTLKAPLSWFAEFLEMKLMPLVYKKIQTITVSPSSKQEILEKELTKVEPIIIYNGVDLNKYKPAQKSKTPLVLYVGRLKQYKSLNVFLHTAKKILEKIPDVKFAIAGDGEEKASLIKLAQKLNILNRVSFLGKVSEEDKISLYQKAWVFVNPSLMEGWGITSIEANACGTPVVASNVPGLRDSVRNPHSGFLCPYGNVEIFSQRIMKLLKDDSLRAQFSLGAQYWAKQFDWQKSADKSLELFK